MSQFVSTYAKILPQMGIEDKRALDMGRDQYRRELVAANDGTNAEKIDTHNDSFTSKLQTIQDTQASTDAGLHLPGFGHYL